MRNVTLLLLLFLLSVYGLKAQLSVTAQYSYLDGKQWDDVIRLYNFTRPWLENPQPFITHGWETSLGWYVPLKRRRSFFLHPEAGWSRWKSTAVNGDDELSIRMDMWHFQANFNFNPKAIRHDVSAGPLGTRFFIQLSPGISLWTAVVEKNGEPMVLDKKGDEAYQPKSWSPFLAGAVGYRAWMVGSQLALTPILRCRYYPLGAEMENLPVAIQGANVADLPSLSRPVWTFTGGLEITWIIPRKVRA